MKKRFLNFIKSKIFQRLWARLFWISKIGLNYGGGTTLETSGEIYALRYAKSKLRANGEHKITIIDGGANYGQFASAASEIFRKEACIYSFEPSKYTFGLLSSCVPGIQANCDFQIFNCGLGGAEEKLTLYTSGDGSTVASVYNLESRKGEFREELREEISVRRLDNICAELSISTIDYLKLDIEGHELQALLGTGNLLSDRKIQFIQFEFGEPNIDSRTYFRDFYNLLSPDYRIFRIIPKGLCPIEKYTSDLEVFNTVNYLAELKA